MDMNEWYVILALNVATFGSLWIIGSFVETATQFIIDNYEDIVNGKMPKL